jgi:hypothetical protein
LVTYDGKNLIKLTIQHHKKNFHTSCADNLFKLAQQRITGSCDSFFKLHIPTKSQQEGYRFKLTPTFPSWNA